MSEFKVERSKVLLGYIYYSFPTDETVVSKDRQVIGQPYSLENVLEVRHGRT